MAKIATKDRTALFYKDCGAHDAQPITFHHGWPLSSDDWDNQIQGRFARHPDITNAHLLAFVEGGRTA